MPRIFVVNQSESGESENPPISSSTAQYPAIGDLSQHFDNFQSFRRRYSSEIDIKNSHSTISPYGNSSPNQTSENNSDKKILNVVSRNTRETVQSTNAIEEQSLVFSLESERRQHEEKLIRRQERFKNILDNLPGDFSLTRLILYNLAIIAIGFAATIPYTVIPAHDLVLYPEFWYEILFHGAIFVAIVYVSYSCVAGYLMNLRYPQLIQNTLVMCMVGVLAIMLLLLSTYYFWTQLLMYKYPIPLFGFINILLGQIALPTVLWIRFPSDWRKKKEFQERFGLFVLLTFMVFPTDVAYQFLLSFVVTTDGPFQSVIALGLPVIREAVLFLQEKIVRKTSNGDASGAMIILKYEVSVCYTMMLAFVLGPSTTELTSWCLMGADFMLNLFQCLRLLWEKKKRSGTIEKQIDVLEDLANSELSECHGPLIFLMTVALAFHGPNADMIGNISNEYWAYSAIEDINSTLETMGTYLVVDFCSLILCTIILWFFCRINFLAAIMVIQKEFGAGMCLILSRVVTMVR